MPGVSKYTGVRRERNKWRSDIQIAKKKKFLGYFSSEEEAAKAYDNAVLSHSLDRPLNFPDES